MTAPVQSTFYTRNVPLAIHLGKAKPSFTTGDFWKIAAITKNYFNPLSNLALCALGLKEIFIDRLVRPGTPATASPTNNRLAACWQWFLSLITQNSTTSFDRMQHIAHGALYFGSGACGVVYGLNVLNVIKLGLMAPVVGQLSNGLFLMANLVSLEVYIKSYMNASKLATQGTAAEQANAACMKRSAILGILNNLSYIFMSSLNLMCFFSAVALVIGCIGASLGMIKILYDAYHSKELAVA